MIFLGDIASPSKESNRELKAFFEKNRSVFAANKVVFNLEGILADRNPATDNKPILFNHPELPVALKKVIDPIFCLANNHLLDLPEEFDNTVRILKNVNIPFCGAAKSMFEALQPVSLYEEGREILLFNACWDFLLYHQQNPSKGVYVGEMDEFYLLQQIELHRSKSPNAGIVVYFHWSLDLEKLPFPMYRQLSKDLIEKGANIVVGTHAHCIQGGEKYQDGYIVYGLGNFFIPNEIYAGGKLVFPTFSNLQLAIEWDVNSNKVLCHWMHYAKNKEQDALNFLKTESFEDSDIMAKYSQYAGMEQEEYFNFFKKNRRKKILIPLYNDYKQKRKNAFYTKLLSYRARTSRILAKLMLIGWQN